MSAEVEEPMVEARLPTGIADELAKLVAEVQASVVRVLRGGPLRTVDRAFNAPGNGQGAP